ncbi:4Fe-4S binding protein [bacterium]|jgi:pyruvate ferredoxin oxidoreductase delta subunit|nr:4Fe-4S binding protein [bacterium]MBT6832050.1 4Fe-4S binding protein [bacterium]MBT6995831.1 4Fe-4S binding protein [bacterium]MBT7772358.1 4Fe-4S binding protein [bacterium]
MNAKKSNPNLRVVASTASWQELGISGGVVKSAGNSEKYHTGNWVPRALEFVPENCINCGLCWAVCPDDSILLDEKGNMIGVDLDHCKDCGLCVEICPPNKNPDPAKHALRFRDEEKSDF